MAEGVLENRIRRKILLRLLIPLVLLVAFVFNLSSLHRRGLLTMAGFLYPYELPNSIDAIEAFAAMEDLRDSSLVRLEVPVWDTVDTGLEWSAFKQVYAHYVAAVVEDKYIICPLTPEEFDRLWEQHDQPTYVFEGTLIDCDYEVYIRVVRQLSDYYGYSESDAARLIYRYSIQPGQDYLTPRLFFYLPPLAMLVLAVILTLKCVLCIMSIQRYSGLKKLPVGVEPEEALPRIERQYVEAVAAGHLHRVLPGFSVCLADNWIIVETPWSIRFHPADELLWAFVADRSIRLQGPLKVDGKTAVYLVFRGDVVKILGPIKRLDNLFRDLEGTYPWLLFGFSSDKVMAWYNDIKSMADAAKRRRQKLGYIDFC